MHKSLRNRIYKADFKMGTYIWQDEAPVIWYKALAVGRLVQPRNQLQTVRLLGEHIITAKGLGYSPEIFFFFNQM